MAHFSVDALNQLIADNRKRLAQLAITDNPLMGRVAHQLELSVKILERQRDELLGNCTRRA